MSTCSILPYVSVIIPVYNTAKYLNKCIESVINQTLKNIEVILVDDGSMDNSYDILSYFRLKDERVKIFKQKNLYAGVARNNGLKHAIGEYVFFLDSDDYIDSTCLEKMYIKAKKTGTDIVLCSSLIYIENTKQFKRNCFLNVANISKDTFNVFDYPDEIFRCTNSAPMTKLYRRKFIEKNGILFSKYRTSNDIYFTSIAQVQANSISFINEDLVTYRENNDTSVQKKIDTDNIIDALTDIYKRLQEIKLYEIVERSFIFRAISSIVYILHIINFEEKKEFIKKLYDTIFKKIHIINLTKDCYIDIRGYYKLQCILKQFQFYNKCISYNIKQEIICNNNIVSPSVSVIIPIYNVEKYIDECIASIRNQTLKNIEIICVNDGSIDSSLEIVKKIARMDKRISIYSQNNCGSSIARNLGMSVAKGKYTYFIDSDDWLQENALSELYERSEKDNLDLLFFCANAFADDKKFDKITKNLRNNYIRKARYSGVYSGIDMYNLMYDNREYIASACMFFAKTDFYRKNNIKFIDKILHEDEAFTFKACLLAERVGCINKQYYMRRYRFGSTMMVKKTFYNVYGYFRCFLFMCDFASSKGIFTQKNILDNIVKIKNNAINIYNKIDFIEKNNYKVLNTREYILFYINIIDFNENIENKINEIYNLKNELFCINKSISFRIGRAITYLPRKIRDFVRKI